MLSLVIHARHEGCDIAICNDQNLYSPHGITRKTFNCIYFYPSFNKLKADIKNKKKKLTKL